MKWFRFSIFGAILVVVVLLSGCSDGEPWIPVEQPVMEIPLEGPAAQRDAELSGLAWYGDYLILLPQYPSRRSRQTDGTVFALHRDDLIASLEGRLSGPLRPVEIPFEDSGLEQNTAGFEGFESIGFRGEQAFVTIEAEQEDSIRAYLVSGHIAPDLSELSLDSSPLATIEPQADLENLSEEALLVAGDRVITFYEANGAQVNPQPVVHLFDPALQPQGTLALPRLEYRLTDATALDGAGRFWVMNYFYPGDTALQTDSDPLAARYGEGETHAQNATVERLVEFQYRDGTITRTATPPIQLQLLGDDAPRNWEGLARLEGRGFLLATDKFPETILGFVAAP
jgi:hypothetical protein